MSKKLKIMLSTIKVSESERNVAAKLYTHERLICLYNNNAPDSLSNAFCACMIQKDETVSTLPDLNSMK